MFYEGFSDPYKISSRCSREVQKIILFLFLPVMQQLT